MFPMIEAARFACSNSRAICTVLGVLAQLHSLVVMLERSEPLAPVLDAAQVLE